MIWVGSKYNLARLRHYDLALTVGAETMQSVNVVRNLDVWIDHKLCMKQHVIKVAGAFFHKLRYLRQIRQHMMLVVATRMASPGACNIQTGLL